MGSIFHKISSLEDYNAVNLSIEHREQLKRKLVIINVQRERTLSVVLGIFAAIILSLIIITKRSPELENYLLIQSVNIHLILLFSVFIFLFLTGQLNNPSGKKLSTLYILHMAIVNLVLMMCAVIAINNEISNQRPFAFVTAVFSVASAVILNKLERHVVFVTSYVIYFSGIISAFGFSLRSFESLLFSLPLLILGLMVSGINYSTFVNSFISERLIEDKNKQMNDMYKTIEEALAIRTEQLNQAKDMDKLKTAFFSNISHELRTPLNIIYSAEQMLQLVYRDDSIQNRRQEIIRYNNMIQQNCYRLIRLIGNLIDITEIDAGQHRMSMARHDIVKLVQEVTLSTARYIEDRNIKLSFSSEIKEKAIACDAEKIERVILNLLSNAVKFTPEGGKIHVRLYEKPGKVLIDVSDTGIGIPIEMKASIFDRFVKVDKSTARLREGSGIGLAIAKAFVELHKGDIDIISEEGRGSDFIVELPSNLNSCEEVWQVSTDYKCYEKIKMEFSDIYN